MIEFDAIVGEISGSTYFKVDEETYLQVMGTAMHKIQKDFQQINSDSNDPWRHPKNGDWRIYVREIFTVDNKIRLKIEKIAVPLNELKTDFTLSGGKTDPIHFKAEIKGESVTFIGKL